MQPSTSEKGPAPAYQPAPPMQPGGAPAVAAAGEGVPVPVQGGAPPLASTDFAQQQQGGEQPVQGRDWSTGLFDCGANCDEFCISWWCPCIGFSMYKSRLEALQQTGMALPPGQAPACAPSGVLYAAVHCLAGAGFLFDFMARTEIRQRYHIAGNPPADCCTAWCCIPCVQSQHSREIRREEELVRAEGRGHPHEPIAPAYGLGQPSAPPQTTQAQVQSQPSQPMMTPPAAV
ncbi:hypothetical protein JCM8202v2_006211 [Rhodotorula sphaerocarpa]